MTTPTAPAATTISPKGNDTMTKPTIEFTVKMNEFKRKVLATTCATAKEDYLPTLSCIKVIVEAGQVMLVATDRFKLIATRQSLAPDTPHTTGTALLDRKALKYLGMMGISPNNELTVRATETGVLELVTKHETLTIHQAKEEYPAIETMLYKHIEAQATAQLYVFNPNYLDDVVKSFKILHPRDPLVMQGTPDTKTGSGSAPTMFYGSDIDDWVAMLMPTRIADITKATQAARDAFTTLLTPEKTQTQEGA